jgi:hypothetical protein
MATPITDFVKMGTEGGEPKPESLADAILRELKRVREEVLPQYEHPSVKAVAGFAVMMIRREIAATEKAMMEGDVVAMLRCYQALKGTNS